MTEVHASALVDPAAAIGDDVEIGPFCMVGPNVTLGNSVKLHNHVTVTGRTRLSEGVEVFSNAVIGKPPQILGFEDGPASRIEIGPRTVLREHVTVHPGSPHQGGLTRIGADCMMMIASHIAHDCIVGDRCVFANQVTLGGHVTVGEQVWMGGLAAVHQNSHIGAHAFIGGGSILVADVIPFGSTLGNHARLAGINIVGLKRRGFPREVIHDLRAAYRLLFADEGTFQERFDDTVQTYGHCLEVQQVLDFISADRGRPLCLPGS